MSTKKETRSKPPQHYAPPQSSHAANAPIDIGDGYDEPPVSSYASSRQQQSAPSYSSSPESSRDQALAPQDLPPPSSSREQPLATIPRPLDAMAPAVIDTSDLKAFLMRPGPQGAMVQCYIQRRKSGLARLYPTYEVYLKDGEQFLLAARRRKKQKQSNYKVSLDRDDLSRNSSNYFGKLKSNFMGTEFQMYDKGISPDKLSRDQRDGAVLACMRACGRRCNPHLDMKKCESSCRKGCKASVATADGLAAIVRREMAAEIGRAHV